MYGTEPNRYPAQTVFSDWIGLIESLIPFSLNVAEFDGDEGYVVDIVSNAEFDFGRNAILDPELVS